MDKSKDDLEIIRGKKVLYLPEFNLENDMVGRWRHLWPSKYLHEYDVKFDIKGAMEPIIYRPTKEEREKDPKRYAVEIRQDKNYNSTDNTAQSDMLRALKGDVDKADVIVFGRTNNLFARDLFEYAKKKGKVVGYEVDDLTFGSKGVFRNTLKPGDKSLSEYIDEQIKGADFVTVSTPYLRDEAAKLRGSYNNIYTVKNRLDLESLSSELQSNPKREDGSVRIGWAGGKYHIDKLLKLKKTFKKLHQKFGDKLTFVFKGFNEDNMNTPEEMKKLKNFHDFFSKEGIKYELHGYSKSGDWKEYYKDLSKLNLDIFFAPMDNDPAHEGKSELKYLEASLIGAPIVVPNIGGHRYAVKHGKTGILIPASFQDKGFYNALSYLIQNPIARRKIAINARKDLIDNYDVSKSSHELAHIFARHLNKKSRKENHLEQKLTGAK